MSLDNDKFEAEGEPDVGNEDDGVGAEDATDFLEARDVDWAMLNELRQRRQHERGGGRGAFEQRADDELSEDMEPPVPWWRQRCCLMVLAAMLSLVVVGGYQLYCWLYPQPVTCTLDLVRPQKFKVDVTEFFAPRVSAAVQLVLSLRNRNMLRSMLLEQCKLVAYEASTGLKLGSVQQGSLVLAPFSTTQATVTLSGLASSLPGEEQRRLAVEFLGQKALLLTIVATASSRVSASGPQGPSERNLALGDGRERGRRRGRWGAGRLGRRALVLSCVTLRAPRTPRAPKPRPPLSLVRSISLVRTIRIMHAPLVTLGA